MAIFRDARLIKQSYITSIQVLQFHVEKFILKKNLMFMSLYSSINTKA